MAGGQRPRPRRERRGGRPPRRGLARHVRAPRGWVRGADDPVMVRPAPVGPRRPHSVEPQYLAELPVKRPRGRIGQPIPPVGQDRGYWRVMGASWSRAQVVVQNTPSQCRRVRGNRTGRPPGETVKMALRDLKPLQRSTAPSAPSRVIRRREHDQGGARAAPPFQPATGARVPGCHGNRDHNSTKLPAEGLRREALRPPRARAR